VVSRETGCGVRVLSPGETRLPYGHRDTLLSEQGRGWRCSDRPQCPVRTISAGIVTGEQSIDTFGTLSVSRETCL